MGALPASLVAVLQDRYRLDRELGQGGMATVYLAEDLKHHRKVAVKVLRPELAITMGPERFLREIEIAAQLQHPHILPLLDSGEAGGFLYYVMPYIQGESLRDRLARERELPVHEVVRLVVQVADALAHAHASGVVHRDVKPENILLSGRHALVADFGVAKAVTEATGRHTLTSIGIALGTPTYMAPEQAAADKNLDHRVDIYALGVVAYELLAGRPPFTGQSTQEVVAGHLSRPPEPIRSYRASVPAALESIVLRCLEKHPADRWQSTAELVTQLEPLATPSGGMTPAHMAPALSRLAVRKRLRMAAGAIAAALIAAVAWYGLSRPPATVVIGRQTQVSAGSGAKEAPVISPDGRMAAFATLAPGDSVQRLEVRPVDGGNPVYPGVGIPYAWSRDGSQLLAWTQCGTVDCVGIAPWSGGQGRTLLRRKVLAIGASFSPDGRSMAYTVGDSLLVQSVMDGAPRLVASGLDLHSPAWSPDGKWIAYVVGNSLWRTVPWNLAPSSIWIVPAAGGAAHPLTKSDAMNLGPQWTHDGRRLLFVSNRDGARDIYQLNLTRGGHPHGAPIRLTTGLNASLLSVSATGGRIAYSVVRDRTNVWSLAVPASGVVSIRDAVPVTTGNQTIESFDISRDSRWIVFHSNISGGQQLYRRPLAGGSIEQITHDSLPSFNPSLSPDGSEIAYHTVGRDGHRRVYLQAAEGGTPVLVSPGTEADERTPRWTPDGSRIAWSLGSFRADRQYTWFAERGRDGHFGQPRPLGGPGFFIRGWSPDARSMVGGDTLGRVLVTDVQGTNRRVLLAPGLRGPYADDCTWAASGSTIYCALNDRRSRWVAAIPAAGGQPREVIRFDDPEREPSQQINLREQGGRLYLGLSSRETEIFVADLGDAGGR